MFFGDTYALASSGRFNVQEVRLSYPPSHRLVSPKTTALLLGFERRAFGAAPES